MPLTEKQIDLHIAVIKSAVEDSSPFKGMVDFRELLKLPIEDQRQIWDKMGEGLQKQFKKIYMNKEGK